MNNWIKTIIALSLTTGLVTACGGGSGSTSTRGNHYSHAELAREFVKRVNAEISGFDLELVKIDTRQYNYIVVYDWDFGTYDAYYIGQYNVGENLSNYINKYENRFYYGLTPEYGGTYYDPTTGTRFEKSEVAGKNLSKLKALKEHLTITKMAEKLRVQYGLSAEKSLNTARFSYKLQTSPAGTYNTSDYDAFAKELTGSTISEFQSDIKDNNLSSLSQRISTAAETTGMGPEGINRLINDMFLNN